MHLLAEGDEIVSLTPEGKRTTDTVSLLSIGRPDATATFTVLTTTTNHTLALTADHHLPTGPTCCTTLQKAHDVLVGQTIWLLAEHAPAATPSLVTSVHTSDARGLHSPVLTHGTFPLVDGVVTSFDSYRAVTLARYLLPTALSMCKAWGSCTLLKHALGHTL